MRSKLLDGVGFVKIFSPTVPMKVLEVDISREKRKRKTDEKRKSEVFKERYITPNGGIEALTAIVRNQNSKERGSTLLSFIRLGGRQDHQIMYRIHTFWDDLQKLTRFLTVKFVSLL